jgi:hypothetical protein
MMFAALDGVSCLSALLDSSAVSFVQFNPWPPSGLLMLPHTTRLRLTASRRRRRNGGDDACGALFENATSCRV